ncbi:hypothetical protein HRbin05_00257 [archaeon HR05]|nr:hypothetical protein HRbin05_00257 [archaeon HR05]
MSTDEAYIYYILQKVNGYPLLVSIHTIPAKYDSSIARQIFYVYEEDRVYIAYESEPRIFGSFFYHVLINLQYILVITITVCIIALLLASRGHV